ncbi:MAG: dephospho-CoA kinase [Aerococcus sp.]|nr:dephospho-CoA kinase [Aerococcus sp.]
MTGSIATGKSTVSAYLKHSGVPLIDLDEIVHTLQQPNTETMAALVQAFGSEILTDQATLNRHHLGSLIFNDDQAREKLNKTMRPFIVTALREQLSAYQMNHAPLVVLDIPLLFELGYEWWCDQTLVVSVPEPIQIQRLMTRDHLTQTEAEQRIASQWPQKDKMARATHCIDNSESLMNTYQQVDEWLLDLPVSHLENS